MKKYYSLVVSVLDKDGNRIDAHEITGSSNRNEILAASGKWMIEVAFDWKIGGKNMIKVFKARKNYFEKKIAKAWRKVNR